MLTLDGTTAAAPARRVVNTPVDTPWPPAGTPTQGFKPDDGIPAELRRTPKTTANCIVDNCSQLCDCERVPAQPAMVSALQMPNEEPVAAATGAGMIFLRRAGEHKHWVVQFTGIKGLPTGELDASVPCNATLRDVLAWLGATYNGKLGGAWLLVAP